MTRRILIILGHPDSSPARLCRALAEAYADGARARGHEVRIIDIATLDFPILRSTIEFNEGSLPAGLEDAARAIQDAGHLVFVFPLWLGTMPALLKAFLEQVLRPGIAFAYPTAGRAGFAKTLLNGRSARLIVTMGMPALAYRLWYRRHGIAGMRRNILNFVGIAPVRETLLGSVEVAGDRRHARWIAGMRALGARGG